MVRLIFMLIASFSLLTAEEHNIIEIEQKALVYFNNKEYHQAIAIYNDILSKPLNKELPYINLIAAFNKAFIINTLIEDNIKKNNNLDTVNLLINFSQQALENIKFVKEYPATLKTNNLKIELLYSKSKSQLAKLLKQQQILHIQESSCQTAISELSGKITETNLYADNMMKNNVPYGTINKLLYVQLFGVEQWKIRWGIIDKKIRQLNDNNKNVIAIFDDAHSKYLYSEKLLNDKETINAVIELKLCNILLQKCLELLSDQDHNNSNNLENTLPEDLLELIYKMHEEDKVTNNKYSSKNIKQGLRPW